MAYTSNLNGPCQGYCGQEATAELFNFRNASLGKYCPCCLKPKRKEQEVLDRADSARMKKEGRTFSS